MNVKVERFIFNEKYTMSRIYVNDVFFCFGIEPYDAHIKKTDDVKTILSLKNQYGKIAVAEGTYQLIYSFSNKYKKMLPLVCDTPGMSGVRIHSGNSEQDTRSCLCPGKFYKYGYVTESRKTVAEFLKIWESEAYANSTIEYCYASDIINC